MSIYEADFGNTEQGSFIKRGGKLKSKMISTKEFIDENLDIALKEADKLAVDIKNLSAIHKLVDSDLPMKEKQDGIRPLLLNEGLPEEEIQFVLNYLGWSLNERKYFWTVTRPPIKRKLIKKYLRCI